MNLKGVFTALVTPFKYGELDEEALKGLIDFQVRAGVDGISPCGTTGETSTLSYEEHERVIFLTVKWAGDVPVMAGTGSNSTKETVELTQIAKDLGASAALVVAPYYNRPTQEGLYLHFKKVAEEVDIPLVLYNIPGRTGVNMLPELVARLAQIPGIAGIKEASGSVQQAADVYRLTGGKFPILSGDDNLLLPLMSVGASGVISVVSNILPERMLELVRALLEENDREKALDLHAGLMPLFNAMFIETNPVPVKTALYHMGMIEKDVRLPLCELSGKSSDFLKEVLKEYGLFRRE